MLNINLRIVKYHLSLYDDFTETRLIPAWVLFEINSLSEAEKQTLKPLFERVFIYNKIRFQKEQILEKKLTDIETAAEELLHYKEWTVAKKKQLYRAITIHSLLF